MTTQTSLVEKVAELAEYVSSQQQKTMINELKNNGLLTPPQFKLAYGPVSFSNQQIR